MSLQENTRVKAQKGASLVEYLLVISMLTVASVAVVKPNTNEAILQLCSAATYFGGTISCGDYLCYQDETKRSVCVLR